MKTTILPNNSKMVEYSDGTKEWFQNGQRHRTDGPAIEWSDGSKEWYQNGKLHRTDGPAIEYFNGTKKWFQNDRLHRTDGPAIEWVDGIKEWWIDGQLHRTDGPAVELSNDSKSWWFNGKKHRTDGPAIEWVDGIKEWWIDGKEFSKEEFDLWIDEEMKRMMEENNCKMIEYSNGSKEWLNQNGEFHRSDGPAVEFSNGTKQWFQNDQLHRTDGPAIEYPDGSKFWYVNGKLHRTDGPAVEWSGGTRLWYVNGEGFSKEEFDLWVNNNNSKEMKEEEKIGKTSFPSTFHSPGGIDETVEKDGNDHEEKNDQTITMQWVESLPEGNGSSDHFGSMKEQIFPKKKTILRQTKDRYLQIILEEGITKSLNGKYQPIAIVICCLPDFETIIHSFSLNEIQNAIDHDAAWNIWKGSRERKKMKKNAKKVLNKKSKRLQ